MHLSKTLRQLPLVQVAVLSLLLVTMLTAGVEKILGSGVPDWFVGQFKETFLNAFSGALGIQFYMIALIELAIGAICIIGLMASFVKKKELTYLSVELSLLLSSFLFIGLSFGMRITYKFDSAATLFFYAAFCLVILLLHRSTEATRS